MDEKQLTSLARAFREGDMRGFERIVNTMNRPLIAMAYRYTGEWESARDLSQETFLAVYEKIDAYDPARPFSSWLFAIHRNGCLSYIRRAAFRYEVPTAEFDTRPGTGAAATDTADPPSDFERREFGRRLREAMSCLSPQQLIVFTRIDLEQNDQAEAARALGMNPATLRVTLHNARKRLAAHLRKMETE